MRFAAALALALSLALAGTASAAPKDPGLGDRVEFRFHKNAKLRTVDGFKHIVAKVDYRCAPSPDLMVIDFYVEMVQRFPDGYLAGSPGYVESYETLRCTNRWRTATVAAEGTAFAGGDPFRKGPVQISIDAHFVDFVAQVERRGSGEGTAIVR